MTNRRLTLMLSVLGFACALRADVPLPELQTQGATRQLVVDGRPFLIRGGELGNSSATNPDHLLPLWPRFRALHLNTLLVPAYWDLIEPEEGRFDFRSVDQVIGQARANGCRLVLLWFGSWKNSMSSYTPAWIKTDPDRFPRALDPRGHRLEELSAFSPANRETDQRAFAALMRHLRQIDGARTVVMVQVENEIGMIPSARDHSDAADRAYAGAVPADLMGYLESHADELAPGLRSAWTSAGRRSSGTWRQVFGEGPAGEEIFTAWGFARYTQAVAAAGKAEYPLPMYVNAALIRPGYEPGQYPSGGPLPHLFDIWRAAAPSIDLLSPDIYFRDFSGWARRYRFPGNPPFIPESEPLPASGARALYAYGALDALGFSVFSIDTLAGPVARNLGEAFEVVDQIQPFILAHQGRGSIAGLLPEGPEERQPAQIRLGGYVITAAFAKDEAGESDAGGLVVATGPDQFLVAGSGITLAFATPEGSLTAGILSDEEGRFVAGAWQNTLWLGGDQTNQGREIRLEPGRFSLQRVRLYRY